MTKRIIKVQTNRGDLFKIPKDDITNYSVSPEGITYTFKNGDSIMFFKRSLTYIQETDACVFHDVDGNEYRLEIEDDSKRG